MNNKKQPGRENSKGKEECLFFAVFAQFVFVSSPFTTQAVVVFA
jgi:hypothetical protein